jgi:hypothetical protein
MSGRMHSSRLDRRCCSGRSRTLRDPGRWRWPSARQLESVDCGHRPERQRYLDCELVAFRAQVQDERVPADNDARGPVVRLSDHRAKPRPIPAVTSLDPVVPILLGSMESGGMSSSTARAGARPMTTSAPSPVSKQSSRGGCAGHILFPICSHLAPTPQREGDRQSHSPVALQ